MAEKVLNSRLVHCARTSAQWATDENKIKVLKKGEFGLEITLNSSNVLTEAKIKVGDGTTQWQNLPYILDSSLNLTSAEKTKLAGIAEGADNVSYSAEVTSGTKLGTITINGTGYDIYSAVEADTKTRLKYATSGVNLSTNYQTGDIILGAAAAKQVDTTPIEKSANLITSGGVVAYIDTKLADAITALGLGEAAKKGIDTSVSVDSTDNNVPTSKAVWSAIAGGIAANDAMVFKGTLAAGATLPAADRGHTYRASSSGTISTLKVEIGDMLICMTDETVANTPANWTVIQTNIDGAVVGPSSSVANRVAIFDGTTGKIIKDSGYTIGKSVPSDAVFTDTKPKFNGTVINEESNIYAPTAAGTDGQILKSTGGIPTWVNQSTLSVGTASKLGSSDKGGEYIPIYLSKGVPTAVTGINVSLLNPNVTLILDGNF